MIRFGSLHALGGSLLFISMMPFFLPFVIPNIWEEIAKPTKKRNHHLVVVGRSNNEKNVKSILLPNNITQFSNISSVHMLKTDDDKASRVRFIPFPHNTLGSGVDMQCQWETKRIADTAKYDSTQLAAFREGICIPHRLKSSIHVFSSNEAKECLQSRQVIISGDSYMKQ